VEASGQSVEVRVNRALIDMDKSIEKIVIGWIIGGWRGEGESALSLDVCEMQVFGRGGWHGGNEALW